MLEVSLFVALVSVITLLPDKLGASADATWRVSSAVFLVVDGITTSVAARQWPLVSPHFEVVDQWVFWRTAMLSSSDDVLVLSVLLCLVPQLSAGLYLGALITNLILAGLLFFRFAGSTFGSLTTE